MKRIIRRSRKRFDESDPARVRLALSSLRRALFLLKQAGAVRTAERVRLAISSCKGAVRAVGYRKGQEDNRRRLEGTL